MKISIIAAVAENHVIGKDNDLIWRLPADMKFFKDTTRGHTIITGRKNYESIPEKYRPLPDRTNIVITRQQDYKADGAVIASSYLDAIKKAGMAKEILSNPNSEVFIIGGGEIYKQCIPFVDKLYITRVHGEFEGDTFFPIIYEGLWREVKRERHFKDEKHDYDYTFIEYERN